MTELLPFLKQLISAPGLSGYETPVRDIIENAWHPLTDELQISRLGSLHGLHRGSGPDPRHCLLIAAHMDAIGLMVTEIVGEFLRVTRVGGVDPRVLLYQPVTVHGRQDLAGVIVKPPAHLLPTDLSHPRDSLGFLLIDTGLEAEGVRRLVRVGDLVSFAQPPLELSDEYLAGHSLDNRASVAALTLCLQELQSRRSTWDLWAVATSQEEETLGGAMTSTFQLRPTLGIVLDVTFAEGPGSPDHLTYPLNKGPLLSWGPNIHSGMHRALKSLADRLEIPHRLEPIPEFSGTDTIAMQVAAEGIPTMLVEIPLRYMHTPVEMVSLKDIYRTGRLLAEFTAWLDGTFIDRLSWDD